MSKQENNEIVFIDPMSDFGFKKIFGEEPNKDLLISFLNEVFRGRKIIRDLVYNKNEHLGDNNNEGNAIFDLLCTGNDDEKFIIEVQRAKQDSFKKRALFYTSRLISNQAPKGNRTKWNYEIKEVYLIAVLESFTLDGTDQKDYFHDICLCNRDNGEIFYEGLGFIYLELAKFAKTESELETDLDRWLYVLKNMSRMKKIPTYLRKPIFEKLFNIAEYSNLSKEEKTMYDSKQKARWDNYSIMETAKREGLEMGKEEGLKEGLREGLREGLARGKEEKLAIVLKLKKRGLSTEDISSITGLSIKEIEKL